MTRKTTTLRTRYVHVVLNGVICLQILYDIVLYARQQQQQQQVYSLTLNSYI